MYDDVHDSRRFPTPEERRILEVAARCYHAHLPYSSEHNTVREDVQKALPDWTDQQIYRWIMNHQPRPRPSFFFPLIPPRVDFVPPPLPRETSAPLRPIDHLETLKPHIDRLRALLGSVVAPRRQRLRTWRTDSPQEGGR
jgi:hypothetical protein